MHAVRSGALRGVCQVLEMICKTDSDSLALFFVSDSIFVVLVLFATPCRKDYLNS